MKSIILLSTLSAILLGGKAEAQVPIVNKIVPKVILGVKVGVNMQELSGSSWKSGYNTGIVGGAFVGVTKKKIGVQVEGLVKSAKFDFKSQPGPNPIPGFSGSVKAVYLDIPVLFEYKLISRLWLQVGPQFSSLISAKNGSTDYKNHLNTTDIAGVGGLQLILPMHFTLDARYILGVTNINKESVTGTTEAWNNRCIQIALGFRFL